MCMDSWMLRSKTCPVCRAVITKTKIIKLFFEIKNMDLPRKLVLNNMVDNLKFELNMASEATNEAKKLLASEKELTKNLRTYVKELTGKVTSLTELYTLEKNENAVMASSLCETVTEVNELKQELEKRKSYQKIFTGSEQELAKELKKGVLSPEQLHLCLLAYQKDLKAVSSRAQGLRKENMKLNAELISVKRERNNNVSSPETYLRMVTKPEVILVSPGGPLVTNSSEIIISDTDSLGGSPSTSRKPELQSLPKRGLQSPISPTRKLAVNHQNLERRKGLIRKKHSKPVLPENSKDGPKLKKF